MKPVYSFCFIAVISLSLMASGEARGQCNCPGGDPLDSTIYTQSLPPTADFLSVIEFPLFNPSIGTLSCLNISGSVVTVASLGIRNLDSSARTYRFRYTQDISLSGPSGIFTSAASIREYGPTLLSKYNAGVDSVLWGPDTTFNYHLFSITHGGSGAFLGSSGTVGFDFTNTGSTTLLQGSNNYRATVTTFAVASFRLAYYWCPNAVLPEQQLRLSANRLAESIQLNWSTDQDQPGMQYVVEYSRNGNQYSSLHSETSRREGSSTYSFTYPTEAGSRGKLYFRVRRTDATGKHRFSQVRTINLSDNSLLQTTIFPNPVVRDIQVRFTSLQTGPVHFDFISPAGQVLETHVQQLSREGQTRFSLRRSYEKGVYWLRMQNRHSGESSTTAILVR